MAPAGASKSLRESKGLRWWRRWGTRGPRGAATFPPALIQGPLGDLLWNLGNGSVEDTWVKTGTLELGHCGQWKEGRYSGQGDSEEGARVSGQGCEGPQAFLRGNILACLLCSKKKSSWASLQYCVPSLPSALLGVCRMG